MRLGHFCGGGLAIPVLIATSQPRADAAGPEDRTPLTGALRVQKGSAGKLTSVSPSAWIYSEPKRQDAKVVGYLRRGQSVRLRSPEPVRGAGCSRGFLPVEPFGYVCGDGAVQLEPSQSTVESLALVQPKSGALPFHYALSNAAPMYRRLPTPAEWERVERGLGPPGTYGAMSWGNRGHAQLAELRGLPSAGEFPQFLSNGGAFLEPAPRKLLRQMLPFGSMLAFSRVFEHAGRSWLLAADGSVVPADRVRPFRESTFHGVALGNGVDLPVAWIRGSPAPQYQETVNGDLVVAPSAWPARGFILLDPARPPREQAGKRYWAARETANGKPLWLAAENGRIVEPRARHPWPSEPRAKGLLIRITEGTLVAYEGPRPVYATLISPGAGGVPVPGTDPVKMSTTPLGVFRITFKHRTNTMSPEVGDNRSFWIDEVPYAQYFSAPFAIHVAYWHESFGEPMSAGCINVSPLDGKWLFDWTDPALPEDWSAVGPSSLTGKGSWIVVRR